ncbi:MAG: urease accessory protein UreD [Caldilineaceae bacterium]|nr:urease accessory protein UreD [Caldilineaceae bacterium]
MRVFLPRVDPGAAVEVVLANSAGGIAGGDHLRVRVAVGADTAAVITSQAAEKAYRSRGPAADLETRVTVGPRARLAWVPQETILFDGARLCRRLEFNLDGTACLLAGEMWVFGRIARGEVFGQGLLHDVWPSGLGRQLASGRGHPTSA